MLKENSIISKFILYTGIVLLFAVIFFATYAPLMQKDFYYQTDYVLLSKRWPPAAIWNINLQEFRVLNGFLLSNISGYSISSGSVKPMRFVGILGIAIFASVMWTILKKFRFDSCHAFLISASICTLPCMQIITLLNVCIFYIYGASLASLSALVFFKSVCNEESKSRTYRISLVFISSILLVSSFTIYQSAAMMYWAIGVIFALSTDHNDFFIKYRRLLVKYFLVGFISMAIYYIVFVKILPSLINISSLIPDDFSVPRSSFVPIHMIPIKLIKFIIIPLNNAINLWNVYPHIIFTFFSSSIIFGGIVLNLMLKVKEKNQFVTRKHLQKYYLILCLIILSYLPSLIVAEIAYAYRTLIAMGTAISILFFWGLINIITHLKFIPNLSGGAKKTTITILLIIILILTSFMARYNATHWQVPSQPDVYLWEKWGIM